jgi:phosphatidylserine synthase
LGIFLTNWKNRMTWTKRRWLWLDPQALITVPNPITAIQLMGCMGALTLAAHLRDQTANIFTLLLCWVLDELDGFTAQRFRQENLLGV